MKKLLSIFAAVFALAFAASAQDIKVEAPEVVGLDEQFTVRFIVEGEKKPSDFNWDTGTSFKLVWGPQQGSSRSISIVNGKRTSSSQFTYSYILQPSKAGNFTLPAATASVGGKTISSRATGIEVVSNGASSASGASGGGKSSGGSAAAPQGGSSAAATGDIPSDDIFLRFSVSSTEAVVGQPLTATLKLYQRVNISGFEDVKLPTFNGFWSQETEAPTNIQFRRESYNDKIYNSAVIRRYTLIPQQAGSLTIDPAEMVCLVNIRTSSGRTGSIFDDFFDDGYRTVRKRITTPAVTFHVKPLPSGTPASFGGGVGKYSISAKLSKDSLKTHDAVSLIVTVTGRGNVSLLEAPEVAFHPDMDVYDVKETTSSDKGGTNGSKTFEYPFIPRSYGDFTIDPIEYTYYDVDAGRYVTLTAGPLSYHVEKGAAGDVQASVQTVPGVDRKGVRNVGEDIRFIQTRQPSLKASSSFFVGKAGFWVVAALLTLVAAAIWLAFRKMAAMRADVAGTKNRKATKMALGRLKKADEYLRKNLYSAFYEELHTALLGFVSDKFNMGMEDMEREKISSKLSEAGVRQELVERFIGLLDACEFARYSPEGGNEAMSGHYDEAVDVISSIDSSMKNHKGGACKAAMVIIALMAIPSVSNAADYPDSLWNAGTQAYNEGRWADALTAWEGIRDTGVENAVLFYNIGNARFKAGDYPEAILNYEKALKLNPSFSDARFNLEFAQSHIQDRIDEVPEFIFKSWLRKFCYAFQSNTWAVLSLVFFAAALALLLLFLLGNTSGRQKLGFYGAIVFILLALASFGFARWQYSEYRNADEAIVMVPVSSVKSSPSDGSSKSLFILHGGAKVRILDTVGSWNNIELADGRQGWISSGDLGII